MYSFQFELKDGEEILYLGRPELGKGKRSIKGDIQVLGIALVFIGIGIPLLIFGRDGSAMSLWMPIALLVAGLFISVITINSIRFKKKGIDDVLAQALLRRLQRMLF